MATIKTKKIKNLQVCPTCNISTVVAKITPPDSTESIMMIGCMKCNAIYAYVGDLVLIEQFLNLPDDPKIN